MLNRLIITSKFCLYLSLIVNSRGDTSHVIFNGKFDSDTDTLFAGMDSHFKKKQFTTASPFAMVNYNHYYNNQHLINNSFLPPSLTNDVVEPLSEHIEYMDALKPPEHTCQDIQIDMCKNIGYNVTSMPNFVGHELQTEAEIQLHGFLPLISYGCSSQLKFFLCSAYVPMCTEKVPVLIGPCRPLCERIKSRCGPILYELGFEWPAGLNCSMFVPKNTVDHMCMEGPEPLDSELIPLPTLLKNNAKLNQLKAQLGHGTANSNFKSSFTNHDSIYRNTGNQLYSSANSFNQNINKSQLNYINDNGIDHLIFINSNKSSLSSQNVNIINSKKCRKYKHFKEYTFLEHPRARCVAKCHADVLYSGDNKSYMEYWSTLWSCMSLMSCLLTVAVFCLSPPKYRYPERAIFYIAICYIFYSLPYIYRLLVGRETLSCYPDGPDNSWLLVQEGAHNPHCTISFFLFYYFGMAAIIWWLVLVFSWTLSISFGWSLDKLVCNRQIYHTFAWTLPGIQTLAALVVRAVDADELTGTCYIGAQNDENLFKFIIIPMTIYICIGIVLLVFGCLSIRISFNKKHQQQSMHSNHVRHYLPSINSQNENIPSQYCAHSHHYQSAPQQQPLNLCIRRKFQSEDLIGLDSNSLAVNTGENTMLQQCTKSNHFLSTGANCYHNALMTNSPCLNIRSASDGNQNHRQQATENENVQMALSSITCSLSTASSASTSLTNHSLGANNDQMEHALCRKSSGNQHHKYFQTKQQQQLANQEAEKKHVLIRCSIFAILFILPVVWVLFTYIYEYCYRQQWLENSSAIEKLEHKVSTSATHESVFENNTDEISVKSIDTNVAHINIDMINVRLFMSLVIGIKTGIWIILSKLPIALFRFLFSRYISIKVLPYYCHHNRNNRHHNAQMSQALNFQLSQQEESTTTNTAITETSNNNIDTGIYEYDKTKNNNNNAAIPTLIDQNSSKNGQHLIYNNGSPQFFVVDQNSCIAGNTRIGQHVFNSGNNETTFHCLNGSTMSTSVSSQLSGSGHRKKAANQITNSNALNKTIRPLMALCQSGIDSSINPQPFAFQNRYLNNNNNNVNYNNNNNNKSNNYNQCCRCGGNETAV